MNSLQKRNNEKNEEKAIFEALNKQNEMPSRSETDGVFLMQLDVPEAVMKKLRTF